MSNVFTVKLVIKNTDYNAKLSVSLQLKNFMMNSSKKSEEFYKKLKAQLYDTTLWPSEYLYKFIVLSKGSGIKDIESFFNDLGAVITTNASKNGKYTSVSINVKMENPEAVIAKYKEVAIHVKDVISL